MYEGRGPNSDRHSMPARRNSALVGRCSFWSKSNSAFDILTSRGSLFRVKTDVQAIETASQAHRVNCNGQFVSVQSGLNSLLIARASPFSRRKEARPRRAETANCSLGSKSGNKTSNCLRNSRKTNASSKSALVTDRRQAATSVSAFCWSGDHCQGPVTGFDGGGVGGVGGASGGGGVSTWRRVFGCCGGRDGWSATPQTPNSVRARVDIVSCGQQLAALKLIHAVFSGTDAGFFLLGRHQR
jgi:hypothetical protein